MQRRKFLQRAALLPLPIFLNQFRLAALAQPFLAGEMNEDDRVLVLVELNGGNDGLNTLIPLDQYDKLAAVRNNVMLPENQLLGIEDKLALHPTMGGFQKLYQDGKMGIVQNVGYPEQNRSHFRSTDIWSTGSAADEVRTTGWLGRHLDERYPGYPQDYPSSEEPAPFAIVLGSSISETCQGSQGNFSVAIANVDNLGQLPSFDAGAIDDSPYGRELSWLQNAITKSNVYSEAIQGAVAGASTIAEYPAGNELAAKLQQVARLIAGGLQTKVYIVQLGGFDTHADQPTRHPELLTTLSDAIEAFQRDLTALGLEERVVGMTHSEFGRRIRSNASEGTDHGDAAPLFLFGSCVRAGVTGTNPEIDTAVDIATGVPYQYDFRDVYGSLLVDWLGVSEATVKNLLHDNFKYLPLVDGCNGTTATNDFLTEDTVRLTAFPNPSDGNFELSFRTEGEHVRATLLDVNGRELRVLAARQLPAGTHRFPLRLGRVAAGTYFLRLILDGRRERTIRLVKK